jgi:hypothetical protein
MGGLLVSRGVRRCSKAIALGRAAGSLTLTLLFACYAEGWGGASPAIAATGAHAVPPTGLAEVPGS